MLRKVKQTLEDESSFEKLSQHIFLLQMQDFHPKLSDFGLAKAGPTGDMTHVTTQVIGTKGYAAPEYTATGNLNPLLT